MGPQGGPDRLVQKNFWEGRRWGWDNLARTGEGSFTSPGLPWTWRRDDPTFDAACEIHDRCDDLRIIAAARRRALGGNGPALNLCFRAAQGFARPVDPDARRRDEPAQPLSAAVADAMLEAGLRALGETLPDVPPPHAARVPGPPSAPATPPALAATPRVAMAIRR